ncbi:MAG: hypothetical protein ACTHKG_09735 [Nocardioides sp.]
MDFDQTRRARRRALHFVVALLGAVLVVPPMALAPANAAAQRTDAAASSNGLLPLDPTVLLPSMSGAGAITGVAGMACSNLSGTAGFAVPCQDPLTLSELPSLGSISMVAEPSAGWVFAGWSGATDCGLEVSCVLGTSLLSGLSSALAPVATFLPSDDPSLPGACESPLPIPGADCAAPDTTITSSPKVTADKKTKETTAAFAFKAYETDTSGKPTTTETSGATFECQLTGPGQAGGFSACTSPKSYDNLADGSYTFSVKASDTADPKNTDATPATFTWSVVTTEPNTLITSGPKRWALARKATFGLAISPAGSATYRCSLDGAGRLCTGDRATVAFATGTHTFAAQGSDSLGNEDSTPATRTFTLPVNNTDLKGKGWTKAKKKGYFLKTFSTTKKKGAVLKYRSSSIKRVALVVTKGKGYGTVKVYLGKHLLKKVSLAAKRTHKKKLVNIAGFSTARAGTVKIKVVSKGRPVVIEGLGLASR